MIDMISMKTNKVFVSNVSVYRQSQLQVEGKRSLLLGRDISEERMLECVEQYVILNLYLQEMLPYLYASNDIIYFLNRFTYTK